MPTKPVDRIAQITALDLRLQRQFRAGWPESWLQITLPLGSTRALLVLESGYATTPGGIADALMVSRTSVTGMLDKLEAEKLITRQVDPDDRRSFRLAITDSGRALVNDLYEVRRNQLEQALALMDAASLEALHVGLDALTQAMSANMQRARQPLNEGN